MTSILKHGLREKVLFSGRLLGWNIWTVLKKYFGELEGRRACGWMPWILGKARRGDRTLVNILGAEDRPKSSVTNWKRLSATEKHRKLWWGGLMGTCSYELWMSIAAMYLFCPRQLQTLWMPYKMLELESIFEVFLRIFRIRHTRLGSWTGFEKKNKKKHEPVLWKYCHNYSLGQEIVLGHSANMAVLGQFLVNLRVWSSEGVTQRERN